MQNFKFHSLSILAAIIFAYSLSILISNVLEGNISDINSSSRHSKRISRKQRQAPLYTPEQILQSGFFKVSNGSNVSTSDNIPSSSPEELRLLGTITGPYSIARAMIHKKGERNSEIFKLNSSVYGYNLVAIRSSSVKLKQGDRDFTLELFEKKTFSGSSRNSSSSKSGVIKKRISKSEIQQKVLNNLDNAMKGLRAGPYRKNGKVDGYKLIRVRPHNILYKYGIRSGDILKRINGKKIDSTEKLYTLWQGIKQQNSLNVDIERRGKIITYDISITD